MTSNTLEANWRRALLSAHATLQEAIQNLNESSLQIVLVVSSEGVLLGTSTDGDIRRGLLRGLEMNHPIESIIHRDAMVVMQQMTHEGALRLMQANLISALPVVDEDRKVVGLHLLKSLLVPTRRPNLMVIMAGGKGTRLRPHTEQCPKSMLPVGGKPMLEHIIERARGEGFQRFALAIHYLGHMIEEYFGDGRRWQVEIEYLRESSPFGTLGAIRLLDPRPDTPFLVSNGDVLTDIRYGEILHFHSQHGAVATMAVRTHEWEHPFGVVHTQGIDIVGFEEKPIARSHINAGVYVLEPNVLDALELNEHCDMPVLFSRLQEQSARTIVYPVYEPWLDVGRADDLERAHSHHISKPLV